MKIRDVRTRVVRWRGKTVPLPLISHQSNRCSRTAPSLYADVHVSRLAHRRGLHRRRSHGIGNAALAPQVTKQAIDLYLKPLLMGQDPWDTEFLWQHMYRKTMAFGRKGIGMAAISAVDIALWDILGKAAKQPVYRLLGGKTKRRSPVYASRLYSVELNALAAEAKRYKDDGYSAMIFSGWVYVVPGAGIEPARPVKDSGF